MIEDCGREVQVAVGARWARISNLCLDTFAIGGDGDPSVTERQVELGGVDRYDGVRLLESLATCSGTGRGVVEGTCSTESPLCQAQGRICSGPGPGRETMSSGGSFTDEALIVAAAADIGLRG